MFLYYAMHTATKETSLHHSSYYDHVTWAARVHAKVINLHSKTNCPKNSCHTPHRPELWRE